MKAERKIKEAYACLISKMSVFVFIAIIIACSNTNKDDSNILCSCYIFSTAGKTPHYYLEVNKDGVISLYQGSASDSIYYYLSKGKQLPLDSKLLLYSFRDSLKQSKKHSILTRRIDNNDWSALKTNINKLPTKECEHIFARSANNPERIIKIVKKGLTQNGVVIITSKGQYNFWENEGTPQENNLLRIIKGNSPIKIILEDKFE